MSTKLQTNERYNRNNPKIKPLKIKDLLSNGVREATRTPDRSLRSQLRFQNTYQLLLTPIKHKQSINIGKTMLFVYLY